MARLTPDARIPRWIATGYAAVAAGIVALSVLAYALLDRQERDRLRVEMEAAATEAAPRLGAELGKTLEGLPERAGDPLPEALEPYFAEAVSVAPGGERRFPPRIQDSLPEATPPGAELVEEADRLAASGKEADALDLYGLAATTTEAAVAASALLGTAALYERTDDPRRALPFISRAASLPAPAEIQLAARLRQAGLLARLGPVEARKDHGEEAGKEDSKTAYRSILEDLAGLCESWGTHDARPLSLEAAKLFADKAAAALRDLGEAGTPAALERIDEALRSRRRFELLAARLPAMPPGPGFRTLSDPAAAQEGGTMVIVHRPARDGGRDAFRLRFESWRHRASSASQSPLGGRIPLAFDLVLADSRRPGGYAAAVSLGAPPLDGLLLEARPATPDAVERALASSRWRHGLLAGSAAVIFLAAAGLGARNLARAAALSRARAELALSASHEIKTPITLLRAAAETLATRDLDEESRRSYLRTLVVESRRLSDIVGRALDLRRLEEGAPRLERSSQDLSELAREAADSFEPILVEARMRCKLDAPEPVLVSGDGEALASAILALIDNAVRYTPPDASGERRAVEVTVRRDGTRGLLEVGDGGIGIPPEERKKVFEEFYRVPTPLRSAVRGAGLGLSIVRRVVEAHGGSVSIEGREPAGTLVRISLPLEEGGHGKA